MLTPARGPVHRLRPVRAATLTAVAVSLAALAHVVAGGQRPSAAAVLLAALPLAAVTAAASGRRVGRWPTVTGLVAVQAVLHLWFSATGGPGCTLTAGSWPRRATAALASAASSLPFGLSPVDVASCAPTGSGGASGTALVPLSHLLAVVLTGLVVAHGEALVWRLLDLVWPSRPRLGPAVVLVAPTRVRGTPDVRGGLDPALGALRRRGPPRWAPAG